MNDVARDTRPQQRTPIKVKGGTIFTMQGPMTPCSCGCGGQIWRGEPYVMSATTRAGYIPVKQHFKIECWERMRGPLKVRPMTHTPNDRPAKRTNRTQQRILERDKSSYVAIHLNVTRTNKMLEIMEWAGHDRAQAIVYAMIDAGYERWRKRRETNTLPPKPPPLPPKHYGPHLVKVEGFD